MASFFTKGIVILPAVYVTSITLFALSEDDSDGWVSVIWIISYSLFSVMVKPVIFVAEWIFEIIDIQQTIYLGIGFGFVFWLVVGWTLDQYINYMFNRSEEMR